jgi:hypothetical protein
VGGPARRSRPPAGEPPRAASGSKLLAAGAAGRRSGTGVRGRPCAPEEAASRRAAARRPRAEAACGRCSGTGGRPREALRAAGSLLAREQRDVDAIADWGLGAVGRG